HFLTQKHLPIQYIQHRSSSINYLLTINLFINKKQLQYDFKKMCPCSNSVICFAVATDANQ
ncbi:MAG TPA: hypothetical protein PLU10_08000, partial [Chitinophagaceae bacterium]|nr:hypothetical protein [Chitinophagaceae bacterium]